MAHLIFFLLMALVFTPETVHASAAVAAQKKKAAGMQQQGAMQNMTPEQKQMMMQQQMQQQGVPPLSPEEQARQQMLQEQVAQAQVQDVVDIQDVVGSLSKSSQDWTLIIDDSAKEATVSYFINQFHGQGIVIRKPPMYYVSMIDSMAQSQPDMLNVAFPNMLQILAVLDYDFDNGEDKDAMAMRILRSQEAVMKNRQRLGI